MAKPICLIKLDMSGHSMDSLYEFNEAFQQRMLDYHVFVIPKVSYEENLDQMEFEVFHEKDFIPIQFEELRDIIKNAFKKPTTE